MDRWRIWFQHFDKNGKLYAAGVSCETYAHKRSAVRATKKKWNTTQTKWIASKTNPWVADTVSNTKKQGGKPCAS